MIRKLLPWQSTNYTLVAALSTFGAIPALASSTTESALESEIQWLQEESFVSTATKTLEHVRKSGASVSVITRKELELSGARNLMDALKRIPGFSVQTTSIGIPAVSVRGVKTDSSEKVLFMINGHSINNNLVNGGATWAYRNFQINEIKRVEVVRGPGSALYGTNAFVAIINIVTRSSQNIDKPELAIGVGSNQRKTLNFSTAHDSGDWNYALNFNILDTEGMDKTVEQDGLGNSGRTHDWEKRYDLGLNAEIANLQLNAKLIKREAGPYIGIGNALNDQSEQDYLEYFIEASYEESVDNLTIRAKAYFDHFDANNYWEIFPEDFPGFGAGEFPDGFIGSPTVKNDKVGAEVQAIMKFGHGHKLLGGLSFEHQSQYDVEHFTNFNPNTTEPLGSYQDVSDTWNWNGKHGRDISAIYLQNIWDVDDSVRLIIGARNDHYSDFGDSLSPRTSLTWSIDSRTNLTLLYGQAFRAPNFGELYNINTPVIHGNADLDPEEIETFEASVDFQLNKRRTAKVAVFKNNISNIIGYTEGTASNNGKLETNGVELEYSSRFRSGSNFNLNYTYQYPENKNTSTRTPDIPLHQLNTAYTYRHSRYLSAYVGAQYRSSLTRSTGDTRDSISEHTTFDLALNWQNEKDNLSVKASIYNLFRSDSKDASSAVPSDFPIDDRSFVLETRMKL